MQTITTFSLPQNLAQEVNEQLKKGKFSSPSAFIRSAVQTYLQLQTGKLSWEILATPFRIYAKQKKMTETDILRIVAKGRRVKTSKNNK